MHLMTTCERHVKWSMHSSVWYQDSAWYKCLTRENYTCGQLLHWEQDKTWTYWSVRISLALLEDHFLMIVYLEIFVLILLMFILTNFPRFRLLNLMTHHLSSIFNSLIIQYIPTGNYHLQLSLHMLLTNLNYH